MPQNKITFHDYNPAVSDIRLDVINGLMQTPRAIPPKYFYDELGSQIFDRITLTQDYYPTRTEISILKNNAQEIATYLPNDCVLIEPGSGSCNKVMNFIDELKPAMYVPVDISKHHLLASAENLAMQLPWLKIHAICADYTKNLNMSDEVAKHNRVVFFPGSTIGNFHPEEVLQFLTAIIDVLGEQGQLLIGVDLKKDKQMLLRAYDDHEGITAEFNMNLLQRINNQLSADFDLDLWKHMSVYNEEDGRIEMHLESVCDQVVTIEQDEFYFAQQETILTECSYKYTVDEFVSLASEVGFSAKKVWLDDDQLFSVHLFEVLKAK